MRENNPPYGTDSLSSVPESVSRDYIIYFKSGRELKLTLIKSQVAKLNQAILLENLKAFRLSLPYDNHIDIVLDSIEAIRTC